MKLPPPLSWLWQAWTWIGLQIGKVMGFILLTILWIVGFGIYGIVMKIGTLFRSKQSPATYWIDVPPTTVESYKQPF